MFARLALIVLVTRPEPGASATAARLRALGHEVLLAPLLSVEAVDWALPDAPPQAVVMTSGNAARLGGEKLAALHRLPLFAVGAATAEAARAAGFTQVTAGEAGVAALLGEVAARFGSALHLAGEDRIDVAVPPELTLAIRTVYRAVMADTLPDAAAMAVAGRAVDSVLLYSPRTARCFAALCDRHAIPRETIAIAALSPAVLAAAGLGWRSAVAAATPDEAALLAAAGLTCDKEQVED